MKAKCDSGNHPRTGALWSAMVPSAQTQEDLKSQHGCLLLLGLSMEPLKQRGSTKGWVRAGGSGREGKPLSCPRGTTRSEQLNQSVRMGEGAPTPCPRPGTHSSPTHYVLQAVATWGWARDPLPLRRKGARLLPASSPHQCLLAAGGHPSVCAERIQSGSDAHFAYDPVIGNLHFLQNDIKN